MRAQPKFFKQAFFASLVTIGLLAFFIGQKIAVENALRDPASLANGRFDFSNLEGDSLLIAAKDRVIRGAKVVTASASAGVQFGSFQLRDENKIVVDVCSAYSRMQITYMAGDMAVSGEPPQMILNGPCTLTDSADEIVPLMVNYATVLDLQPRDRDVEINKDLNYSAKFQNISDAWPKIWVLKNVKLLRTNAGAGELPAEFTVELREIKQIYGKNILLEWP